MRVNLYFFLFQVQLQHFNTTSLWHKIVTLQLQQVWPLGQFFCSHFLSKKSQWFVCWAGQWPTTNDTVGPFIWTASNFLISQFGELELPIFQIFWKSVSQFCMKSHSLIIFCQKATHLVLLMMIELNFRNYDMRFPQKYQANFEKFRYVVIYEVEKLEDRFSKLWKIRKAIFQNMEYLKNWKQTNEWSP